MVTYAGRTTKGGPTKCLTAIKFVDVITFKRTFTISNFKVKELSRKILHGAILDSKIVIRVCLAIRKLKLKYLLIL